MTEVQNNETAVDPIEQAREDGYRRGLYEGQRKAQREVFTEFYALVAKLHPHFEGLVVARAFIMSYPFYSMDIPEGMTPLAELKLGGRTHNLLMRSGVRCIELLLTMSEADLLDIQNFGEKSLDEIKAALTARGMALKPM